MVSFTSQTRPLRRESSQRRQPEEILAVISLPLAVVGVNRRRILSSLVSGEKRLKALGDNAIRWRHESNVIIYEISHASFGVKASRQVVNHLRLLKDRM